MDPAIPRRCSSGGFTLIEILVVVLISVGLVVLMAVLYRAVGQTALAVVGGYRDEWQLQQLIRDQLGNSFSVPGRKEGVVAGESDRLVILSWRSKASGLSGRPVIAEYQFDAASRALLYREADLPAWWGNEIGSFDPTAAAPLLAGTGVAKLIGAVESLEFGYLPEDAKVPDVKSLKSVWNVARTPKLVWVKFSRGARETALWIEPSARHE